VPGSKKLNDSLYIGKIVLENNTVLEFELTIGKNMVKSDSPWVPIMYNGFRGYVKKDYIREEIEFDSLYLKWIIFAIVIVVLAVMIIFIPILSNKNQYVRIQKEVRKKRRRYNV